MKGKVKLRALFLVMIMMLTMLATSLTAFADQTFTDAKAVVDTYAPGGSAGNSVLPAGISGYVTTVAPSGSSTVNSTTVNNVTYYWDVTNEQYIINAGNSIANKAAAAANDAAKMQEFSDITNSFNVSADVSGAGGLFSGFMGVLRVMLGVLVVCASLGMTVFTGFDVCYIAFPVFRNNCENAKQTGTGIMASNKKTASGETKLRFVSDDAQYAVSAANTVESGKNAFGIYLRKRAWAYMILAIVLFIFLTGRITIFTDIALKLVSGFLDIIQGL